MNKQYNCLNPWNIVVLDKLIVAQVIKKFLAFYVTQTLIAVITKTRH
jgi:hypothetical protein